MNEWWLIGLLGLMIVSAGILVVYPLRRSKFAWMFLLPLFFISVGMGYYFWGSFEEWQQFAQQNDSKIAAQQMLQSIKNPQELIDKLKERLDDNPKSSKGWYLLGKLYSNQKDTKHAAEAFAKAHQLDPDDEQYFVYYAHSLWVLNHEQFSPEIRKVFREILTKNPNQPDALSMLAMNAFLGHAYEDAINYWQRLLKLVPEQSEESNAIRKAIAKAQARIHSGSKNDD